ncbi:MAG: YhdP family protein [Noviherbaspirillum sp.]
MANRLSHHLLGALLTGLLVLYFIFCTAVLGLRYLVLPNIDRYKADVEQMASKALARQVTIATLHASWRGLNPHLVLNNVVVHNRGGEPALSLPQVSATLSWRSLMVADLRLHSLQVDRPDLEVERTVDGKLYVGGVLVEQTAQDDRKGLDWLLSQRQIVVRNGWVRWRDAMRGAPELKLEKVDFLLQNQWRHHRFALKATPPAELGAPLDVRANFSHPSFATRISDVRRWTGMLYADWRDTDLAKWRAYIDYPVEVRAGSGAVRAWLQFDQARVANFTADLSLSGLWTRLGRDLEPLSLKRAEGRISASEVLGEGPDGVPTLGALGHSIALTDFSMETEDGLKLPSTTISETFVAASGKTPQRTEVKATLLELQTIASFVGRLPLDATWRHVLSQIAPRGVLSDFAASWHGEYPHVSAYRLKGGFSGLSVAPQAARAARAASGNAPAQAAAAALPGFDNLSGSINASEDGGSVSLASRDAALHLPGYLAEPLLPLNELDLRAKWTLREKDQLQVDIDSMRFRQPGMAGSVSGKYQTTLGAAAPGSPGVVDLTARISDFDIGQTGRLLPLQTPAKLRDWLSGALLGGRAREVSVVLKGELAHFPFHGAQRQKGQFLVTGKLEDGRLNYAPGEYTADKLRPMWPLVEKIRGNFSFERARMEIHADSAQTSNVTLSKVDAVIADLLDHEHVLEIRGDGAGALQDVLQFTRDSPVAEWIGHFTEQSQATGNARLALKLQLPLAHLTETKVQGALQFAGNDVTLEPALPALLQTSGELKFHEKGFALNNIRSTFLGGPATVSGGQRDTDIAVRVEGAFSAEGVRKAYPAPAIQRLLGRINGGSRYTAQVNIRNKRPEIIVESSLQGLALDFPAPLSKAAAEALPLRFELAAAPSAQPPELRDELRLALGKAIEARYSRRKPDDRRADWEVVRGGIGVNAPAPQPERGLQLNVAVDRLDTDAWRNMAAAVMGGRESAVEGKAAEKGEGGMSQYADPDTLAARAGELIIMGKKLENVVVGASHEGNVWQANVSSTQASGHVTWNESRSGRGLGKVTARLSSLTIPEAAAADVSDLSGEKSATTQIPALDIVAEQFELGGKKLGRLELAANNVRTDTWREWRIGKLSIANPDGVFNATGKWTIRDGQNLSGLKYTLDVADAGRLLARFGFVDVLRGGRGNMQGELNWDGLPFSIDMPSLSGQVQLDLASGQFLKVDPGAAKLLGVLSLQSLPRRLTLDFRDVFSEGFAFDGIVASAGISHGIMTTDSFKMRSVSALVLLDGSVDIVKETQNLNVVVLPEINVGAASVAYGLMVNPVIGLGTFLAQLLLRDPLTEAFTMEYQIAGSWKDPEIAKVDRRNRKASPVAGDPAASQEKQAR